MQLRKETCIGCECELQYTKSIPTKQMGVMMHMGERFCTGGKRARKGLAPYTLPTDLAWFIDQLSEKIVLEKSIYACAMCAIKDCPSQASGMTCRNGVKAWLLSQANEFFPAKAA